MAAFMKYVLNLSYIMIITIENLEIENRGVTNKLIEFIQQFNIKITQTSVHHVSTIERTAKFVLIIYQLKWHSILRIYPM